MFSFVAFDLETTGLDPSKDEIIEFGLVKVIEGQETEVLTSLVRPGRSLPVRVKRLTGLQDSDFNEAPEIEDVLPQLLTFIGDLPMVGHNIRFDYDFLVTASGQQLKNELYDTLELSRYLLPSAGSHRLGDLCESLAIIIPSQHRALDDARGSANLLIKLLENCYHYDAELLWQLSQLLKKAGSTWSPILESLSVKIIKQFPDRKITKTTLGAPFEDMPQRDKGQSVKRSIALEGCSQILGHNGSLAATLTRFQHRTQQSDMMEQVVKGLNESKIVLVEAGTGTGKSLAYLVPAIQWAQQNGERVLVTTHTIALQEQLCNKDIPLLANLPDLAFTAALLKGRSNYLCLRRWSAVMSDLLRSPEEAAFLAKILIWLHQTQMGDKSELLVSYQELEHWYSICCESDGCLGSRCRYFSEGCFFMAARRRAEQADLVVVNHSLLLSDANADNMVLPSYGPLIIDEAHHLESCATEHLGRITGRTEVLRWLSTISKLTPKLEQILLGEGQEEWQKLLHQTAEARLKSREHAVSFYEMLARWAEGLSNGGEMRYSLRFSSGDNEDDIPVLPSPVDSELDNLLFNLRTLCQCMVRIYERLTEGIAFDEDAPSITRDLSSWTSMGQELVQNLDVLCRHHKEEQVYWVEGGGQQTEVILRSAPIDVGPVLYDKLFRESKAVILTSATLTVDGNFMHYRRSIGLDFLNDEQIIEKQLDSPFNYSEQALLCVAKDILQPNQLGENAYHDKLAEAVFNVSMAANGRTLVLFTSHRSLREVYHRLKEPYEKEDICLLGHELDGSRRRLVEHFINSKRVVLFGASSFWEGVDIPGDALSCVILVKLPFAPPNHPVIQARLQSIAKEGRNGFQEYQLPQAVIKFKQGFGRLIRDSSDKGTVVVLDGRLIEKRYGSKFFNSLPLREHYRGDFLQIAKKVRVWLE